MPISFVRDLVARWRDEYDWRAHGGDPADALHVVISSLAGFGFSGHTAERGWGAARTAASPSATTPTSSTGTSTTAAATGPPTTLPTSSSPTFARCSASWAEPPHRGPGIPVPGACLARHGPRTAGRRVGS
ncbi:hypothetical protein [Actinomadura opuntiae]|uniref:hypothetical protein n=1 Tax=Actinomadura sp. OS1-43 TaxID=604315 RepID=UPI00333E5DAA